MHSLVLCPLPVKKSLPCSDMEWVDSRNCYIWRSRDLLLIKNEVSFCVIFFSKFGENENRPSNASVRKPSVLVDATTVGLC